VQKLLDKITKQQKPLQAV